MGIKCSYILGMEALYTLQLFKKQIDISIIIIIIIIKSKLNPKEIKLYSD